MKSKYYFIIIIFFIITGCSGLNFRRTVEIKEEKIECYPGDRPRWMDFGIESDNNFEYFIGHSIRKAQERDARDDAMNNAISKLVKYCGMEVQIIDEYLSVAFDKSSKIIDPNISLKKRNHQRAEAFTSRIKGQEWYDCKVKYYNDKLVEEGWLSSVLISIPKDEIEKIKKYDEKLKEDKQLVAKKLQETKTQEEERKKLLQAQEQKLITDGELKKKQIEIEKTRVKIKSIFDIYKAISEQEIKGEIISALDILEKVEDMIKQVSNEVYFNEILKEEKLETQLILPAIELYKKKIKNNIIIEKISGDGQIIKKGEGINKPIEIGLKYYNGERDIPIKNVPISIGFPEKYGKMEDVYTDSFGKAVSNVFGIKLEDYGYTIISADLVYKEEVIKSVRFVVIIEKPVIGKTILFDSLNIIDTLFNKIRNEKSEFNIEIRTDKKDFFIGEYINFYIKSNKDCYVTLIDVATSGAVYILFPNKYSQDNFIQAGKEYNIPNNNYGFKMKVYGPAGTERIKAIATTQPVSIFDVNFNKPFFEVDTNNKTIAKGIELLPEKLNNIVWAEAIYKFELHGSDTY